MSARAGNSIRSSRSPAVNAARRDTIKASSSPSHAPANGNILPASADASSSNSITPRSQNGSCVQRNEPLPAPSTLLRRPVSHNRNIPFHTGSIRTAPPPAVLPRPQREASQPPPPQQQQQPGGARPRASSYDVTQYRQPVQQQSHQHPSPRQTSAQTTANSSSQTLIIHNGGSVPSSAPPSAPAAHPLPRERGVYPAPHGAARPSPIPHHVSRNDSDGYPTYSTNSSAVRDSKRQQEISRGSPHQRPPPPPLSTAVHSQAMDIAPYTQELQQEQPHYSQPSQPRVQQRVGGVYLESMDTIPKSTTRTPLRQQQQQPRQLGYVATDATSTALTLRPSPPVAGQPRRRSKEDSCDCGTGTEDLEAYVHAVPPRRIQPPPQSPRQQQLEAPRPADYYSLAPSLRLGQHRHVRRIVAGEISREPPQPFYDPLQQQQQQQEWWEDEREAAPREDWTHAERVAPPPKRALPPPPPSEQQQQQRQPSQQYSQQYPAQQQWVPPRQPSHTVQRPDLESSNSLISEVSSTHSSRTRQVFRRQQPQQRPFMTGALPAGSPYGAKPTYAVVIPRTHRVPAGLYAPPPQSLTVQPPPQPSWEAYEAPVADTQPTVEEPYYVLDEDNGRVVEYEPDAPPPQQRQLPLPAPSSRARTARPKEGVPPPPQPQEYAERPVPLMRQIIHFYPSPQQQPQPQPQRQQQPPLSDAYNELTPSERTYNENSYSYTDDEAAAQPPQPPPRRRPPPPPQPSSRKPKPKRRRNQPSALPPSPSAPSQQKHHQEHESGHHHRLVHTLSGGSQQAPPPTLPPPRPLCSNDDFRPSQLDYHRRQNQHHRDRNRDDYDGREVSDRRYANIHPTRSDDHAAAAGRRPPAQEPSEQPSSATLAAPLQPGYRLDEHDLRLDYNLLSEQLTAAREGEDNEDKQMQQRQHQQQSAHPPKRPQRRNPSPMISRERQLQEIKPRPRPKLSATVAGTSDDAYTQAAAAHHTQPPQPAEQQKLEEGVGKSRDEVHEEEKVEQAKHQDATAVQQQHLHSTVGDLNGSESLDLDSSTIDPDDLLAQQEAKKLAAELVRRSLLPPTPCATSQLTKEQALYNDDSEEEEEEEETAAVAKPMVGATEVVAPQPTQDGTAHTAEQQQQQQATEVAAEEESTVDIAVSSSTTSSGKETQNGVATTHASPTSANSEVPHSIHAMQGPESMTVEGPLVRNPTLEGLDLSAPERLTVEEEEEKKEHDVPVEQQQVEKLEAAEEEAAAFVSRQGQQQQSKQLEHPLEREATTAQDDDDNHDNHDDSVRELRRASRDDATKQSSGVNRSPDHHPDHHEEQSPEANVKDAELDLPEAEARQKVKEEEKEAENETEDGAAAAAAAFPAQLATPMPRPLSDALEVAKKHPQQQQEQQPAQQPPEKTAVHQLVKREDELAEDENASRVVEQEDDVGASPLEIGERYGYVDPLDEAAMDAAYMLDTLEDQYVRVNEETGEEMEDLVHVVELNRYDRAAEPRYFVPKGQYSDVLPLLRYPVSVTNSGADGSTTATPSAADALTYVPLTETAYLNLCAVIWLSRFHSEDAARLLSLAQGLSPAAPSQQVSTSEKDASLPSQVYYFDHPSAQLLEVLDHTIAGHVQSVVDEACAQSGESVATTCVRLADRNNLSYLPPAVWQQTTTGSQLSVGSIADHVTEVLLTATVPREAARRQAARRRTTNEAERQAQKTWPLFLGALPWDYEEAVETGVFAAMPTAAARLSYAFMFKARMHNLLGGLGALTFSAITAQVPDTAVMDSLLMQEKLRLALLHSHKNVAACCALRRSAMKSRNVSSSPANSHVAADHDDKDSLLRDDVNNANNNNANAKWSSPVFSAYLQLWEKEKKVVATPTDSLPRDQHSKAGTATSSPNAIGPGDGAEGNDDEMIDLYSVAVQLNCFFPTKTERGMHQLCAALIEDLISMGALVVPESVCTPEGAVLTDSTAIVDALVVEGAQAMRHIIMTLSELGYTRTISTDDYVDAGGHVDAAGVREAMEGYLVLFDPGVMYFLSTPVPVNDLFQYIRSDGPPTMQPHSLGRKSMFVEVLRLQHLAETIQYAMEMQDAILVASQYNHLVAQHYKRMKQQRQQRQTAQPTPRTVAEELRMDAVVVGQSMDLLLNAAPLLSREAETNASSLAELSGANGGDSADGAAENKNGGDARKRNGGPLHGDDDNNDDEAEDVILGQDGVEDANAEVVLLRAVLIALCCADPTKPLQEVQEYLRHLLALYAEVRDEHNNPIDSSDPLQVTHARATAAEWATVDWFGQTAEGGTLQPGAAPARCDEMRVNSVELAALCPRVLGRRVGLASTAVADAAAVISASAQALAVRDGARATDGSNNEDSVLTADASSRPPLAPLTSPHATAVHSHVLPP